MRGEHPKRQTPAGTAASQRPVSSLTRPQWRPGSGCGDGPDIVRSRRPDPRSTCEQI